MAGLCTRYYTKEGELRPIDEALRGNVEKAISDFADEVRGAAPRGWA